MLCAVAAIVPEAAAQSVPVGNVLSHLTFDETTGVQYADGGNQGNDGSFCRRWVNVSECDVLDASQVTTPGQVGAAFSLNNDINGLDYDTLVEVPSGLGSSLATSIDDNFAISFWLSQPQWRYEAPTVAYEKKSTAFGLIASMMSNGFTSQFNWTIGIDPEVIGETTRNRLVVGTDVVDDGGQANYSIDVDDFQDGSAHHFVIQFTQDGFGGMKEGITAMYVDGQSIADAGLAGYFGFTEVESLVLGCRQRPDISLPINHGALDDFAIINAELTTNDVQNIYNQGVANAGLSLAAHYALDETSGTTVTDSSGNGNDGALRGFCVYHPQNVADGSVTGAIGNGVSFDTSEGEFVHLAPRDGLVSSGEAFTVMFWAKTDNWDSNGIIATQQKEDDFGFSIGLYAANDGLIVRTRDYQTGELKYGGLNLMGTGESGLEALAANQYAHFAVVFDDEGNVAEIYVNGTAYTQDVSNGWNVNYDLGTVLGARMREPSHSEDEVQWNFSGSLDDFAIILGELNASQIGLAMSDGVAALISHEQIPGDATGDGKVDEADAQRLATNWGSDSADWSMGNFNGDDVVDVLDAAILAANWGYTSGAESVSAVPEPGTLGALLVALTCLLFARRGPSPRMN
jgi:hypothetical protein